MHPHYLSSVMNGNQTDNPQPPTIYEAQQRHLQSLPQRPAFYGANPLPSNASSLNQQDTQWLSYSLEKNLHQGQQIFQQLVKRHREIEYQLRCDNHRLTAKCQDSYTENVYLKDQIAELYAQQKQHASRTVNSDNEVADPTDIHSVSLTNVSRLFVYC